MKGERVILGEACPECGGTEYYCADCLDDLHGDGEKGEDERKYPCSDCGKLMTKAEGGTTFTVCEACWDKHYKRDQPSPTPTRAEWEEFEMMTDYTFQGGIYSKTERVKLRHMPCVPKEVTK